MKDYLGQKASRLDPRLKRLINSIHDLNRLAEDKSRLNIESIEEAPVSAEQYTKRVLIRCAIGDQHLNDYSPNVSHIVGRIYSAEVPISRLEELANDPIVEYIEAGRQFSSQLDTSVAEAEADNVVAGSGLTLDGTGVVVGIIDFGLDYTLEDFQDTNGNTRVRFLWDQNLTALANDAIPRFGYGVEYNDADINTALGSPNPFNVVRHNPSLSSHGTHVAGIATGNGQTGDAQFPAGQFSGVAPGADIIFCSAELLRCQFLLHRFSQCG